ncbi:MAG TPA: hypothetical protein VD962_08465 [Rubricoccaceae bacterium]|nr:hypothetical protein [Rubricoccaceae bacterium]
MSPTSPLFSRTLAQARADWLAGDPAAWSRYTDALARLEGHLRTVHPRTAAKGKPLRPLSKNAA